MNAKESAFKRTPSECEALSVQKGDQVSRAANSQMSFVFLILSYTYLLSHISGVFVKMMCQEFRPLKRDIQAPSSVSSQ